MPPTKIDIDVLMVEKLASLGCSGEEIAEVVGCSRATLYRRCETAIKRGHAQQCVSLRKFQWDAAKAGSAALLIWLGKQYLGQRDRPLNDRPTDQEEFRAKAMAMDATIPEPHEPHEGNGRGKPHPK